MSRNVKVIVSEIMSTAVGILASAFITKVYAPYLIAGVKLERGYDAVGGEVILIAFLFFILAYGFRTILYTFIKNNMEDR